MTRDLPQGWTLVSVSIHQDHIDVEYSMPEREVHQQVSLRHVSWSGEPAFRTRQFAVFAEGPGAARAAAEALLTCLEENMLSAEKGWSWSTINIDQTGDGHGTDLRLPPRFIDWMRRSMESTADRCNRAMDWVQARAFMQTPTHPDSPYWKDTGEAWSLIYTIEGALAHEERITAAAALKRLEQLVEKLAPRSRPVIDNQLGFFFSELGDEARSGEWFRRARTDAAALIEAAGSSRSAFLHHVEMARADIGLGSFADPGELAERLVGLAPTPADACPAFELARSLRRRGRADLGVALLRRLHGRLSECREGYRIAAGLAVRTEGSAGLLDLLEAGAERFPEDVGIVSALAEHYKYVGEPEQAIGILQGLVDGGARSSGLMGPSTRCTPNPLRGLNTAHGSF